MERMDRERGYMRITMERSKHMNNRIMNMEVNPKANITTQRKLMTHAT